MASILNDILPKLRGSKKNKESETTDTTNNNLTKQQMSYKTIKNNKKLSYEQLQELNTIVEVNGHRAGAEFLMKQIEQDEQLVNVNYQFSAFAPEGAYAVYLAMIEKYGKFDLQTKKAMSRDKPPSLITVYFPDGSKKEIPWGMVQIPEFGDDDQSILEMGWNRTENKFVVQGTVRRRFKKHVDELAELVREKLENENLYKGQAISVKIKDGDGDIDYEEPKFLDLSNININDIVIGKTVKADLNPIIQRIEKTEICRKNGLDLKYGALLEGAYGTGKTLIAFMLAKIATQNDWTFIYLENCHDTAPALRLAENYAKGGSKGCLIFSEDIDQAMHGDRDQSMQEILNTIDGGDTKGIPIISIFTTNHLELIEPTFLRGKRIGSIISLQPLDEETAHMFIEKIATDKNGASLMKTSDWSEAAKALSGIVPAFAHEVIDASKIYMIARGGKYIDNSDIKNAAESYKRQIEVSQLKAKNKDKYEVASAIKTVLQFVEKSIND